VALYVDRLRDYTGRVPYRHKEWCHLVADSDEELQAAARALGAPARALQGTRGWDTHLDLPAPWRPEALALGAAAVDFRFMARRTRARRAALAMGAHRAVGAPSGTSVEVPLPPGRWVPVRTPVGLVVGLRDDHPLLPGRAVVTFASAGEHCSVVELIDATSPARPATVAVVLGGDRHGRPAA
jgi:hypothetical protein